MKKKCHDYLKSLNKICSNVLIHLVKKCPLHSYKYKESFLNPMLCRKSAGGRSTQIRVKVAILQNKIKILCYNKSPASESYLSTNVSESKYT